jgi:methionyl-tRNA synthetase
MLILLFQLILKRFYISRGIDSFFLTGTDEHGQKVEKAAH